MTDYTVTISLSGGDGVVSPGTGALTYQGGETIPVTITPGVGYKVQSLTVNGLNLGEIEEYTIKAIAADTTIAIVLAAGVRTSYLITPVITGSGGTLPASAVTVYRGRSQSIGFIPATGHYVASLEIDTTSISPTSSYLFETVTASHTVAVTFGAFPEPSFVIQHKRAETADWSGRTLAEGEFGIDLSQKVIRWGDTETPKNFAECPSIGTGAPGVGVATGGTTGQALKKKSNSDYDTEWGDVASATVNWGSIQGTLSLQTDLQSALDAKIAQAHAHTGGTDGATISYNSLADKPATYTLPTATASVKGGVMIGSRLTMTDGVLSADVQSGGGDVTGPVTTTENKIPQWDATTKKLKDGLAVGTIAGTLAAGDDSRFTNARAPTAHNLVDTTGHPVTGLTAGHFLKALSATTYGFAAHGITAGDLGAATTGAKLDDFGTPDDNTDLDATTGRHGLLPKLGGGTTNFLRADGTWAAPAGGSAATHIIERRVSAIVTEQSLDYWVAPASCTINFVKAALVSAPSASGTYFYLQVMNNGVMETNSVLNGDAPVQIDYTTSAVKGVYPGEGALDPASLSVASGDVIHFRINQADTGCAGLLVQMKVTFT